MHNFQGSMKSSSILNLCISDFILSTIELIKKLILYGCIMLRIVLGCTLLIISYIVGGQIKNAT